MRAAAALLVFALASPVAAQTTLYGDAVVLGTFTPTASPITAVGLPSGQTGSVLRTGTGGLVGTGPLVVADIPTVFTRRDVNESITGAWTFVTLAATGSVSIGGALSVTGPATVNANINIGGDLLPTTGYKSNIGALTNKFLSVHAAELWVETLVAQDTMATTGGRLLVGTSNPLIAALAAGGGSDPACFKYNNLTANAGGPPNADTVYFEANGQIEFMWVQANEGACVGANGATGTQYRLTRNVDGTGGNAWAAGDVAFNTGRSPAGTGWIDLYAVRGVKSSAEVGPTIVGNVRTSDVFNGWAPRWAVGPLNGLYGYTSNTVGSAFGDPAQVWVSMDAANGFRVMLGSTPKGVWDTAGVITLGNTTANNSSRVQIASNAVSMDVRDSAGTLKTIFSAMNLGTNTQVDVRGADRFYGPGVESNNDLNLTTNSPTGAIVLAAGAGMIRPLTDATRELGTPAFRFRNIHLALTAQTAGGTSSQTTPASGFPYLVTGDATQNTKLGYYCGITGTVTITVPTTVCAAGSRQFKYQCGVLYDLVCN